MAQTVDARVARNAETAWTGTQRQNRGTVDGPGVPTSLVSQFL